MTIPPVNPIGPAQLGGTEGVGRTERPLAGFSEAVEQALQGVSSAEHQVDALAQDLAIGGDTTVTDVMIATSKAQLSVEMLVQVRNKAVEAYQEIMRMQV